MVKNVKAKELINYYEEDKKEFIKYMLIDTRIYATYSGIDTTEYDDFYCDTLNHDIYLVFAKNEQVYLLYSSYKVSNGELKPSYKILMNVNRIDNSCVYDYFETENNSHDVFANESILHYRLESKLSKHSTYGIGNINNKMNIEDISHNFFYSYTFSKEADIEEEKGNSLEVSWPTFVAKYGYRVYDAETLSDASHYNIQKYTQRLSNYLSETMGMNEEDINAAIEHQKNNRYIDGENIYANDKETIEHHLKYKEKQIQKRKELVRVLKQIDKL